MLAGSLPRYFFCAFFTKFEACSLTTVNCVLENAVRRTPEGSTMKLERVYVNARTIRFVHVPKDVDPSELIERKRLERFEASRHYQRLAAFGPRNPQKPVGGGTTRAHDAATR